LHYNYSSFQSMAAKLLGLLAPILALVACALFIAATAASWYTTTTVSTPMQPKPSGCTVSTFVETRAAGHMSWHPCAASCNDTDSANNINIDLTNFNGVTGGPCGAAFLIEWIPCKGSILNNNTCDEYEAAVVRSCVAMTAIAAIFMFAAFVVLFLVSGTTEEPSAQAAAVIKFKVAYVFPIAGFIFGLIALIILPAAYVNGLISDANYHGNTCSQGGANMGQPACPTLFSSDNNTVNSGGGGGGTPIATQKINGAPGASYWVCLAAVILTVVVIILAIIVSVMK